MIKESITYTVISDLSSTYKPHGHIGVDNPPYLVFDRVTLKHDDEQTNLLSLGEVLGRDLSFDLGYGF